MRAFVDTSALYALLDEDDTNHPHARDWLSGPGSDPGLLLITHGYVVVETSALVHRRLGAGAVRILFDAFIPSLSVAMVDQPLHDRAVAAYLAGLRGGASLVDAASFQFMRHHGLRLAFTFDRDFAEEGFEVVPVS